MSKLGDFIQWRVNLTLTVVGAVLYAPLLSPWWAGAFIGAVVGFVFTNTWDVIGYFLRRTRSPGRSIS